MYNIARSKQTGIAELAETIRDAADTDAEVTYTDPRPGDIDESVADISKARAELGFEPTVSLTFNEMVAMINDELGTDIEPAYIENPLEMYVHDTMADYSKLQEATG